MIDLGPIMSDRFPSVLNELLSDILDRATDFGQNGTTYSKDEIFSFGVSK